MSSNEPSRCAVVISASSDIGIAMCERWQRRGWKVSGTFRTRSAAVNRLESEGVGLVECDLTSGDSTRGACAKLGRLAAPWDVLVLCPGTQEPVGAFAECKFREWEESIRVNFTGQLEIIHELLPKRSRLSSRMPTVLLFAGGGTNNAPVNYSGYIISKIALIKMCELLDAEIPDTRFVIVGPGWVATKIHEATLQAGPRVGPNYQRTIEKLRSDECTPMHTVLDCCDWLIEAPRQAVGGRNFSTVFDLWGTDELIQRLTQDPDMYKLRRCGNDATVRR
jgi:NAD(P)-dependent dehydrogenase (short-subunit alcohol dehydrogenase family)